MEYDVKSTISKNRLLGLWRLLSGYKSIYSAAVISLGIAALSKTGTYMLLRYFTDQVLLDPSTRSQNSNLINQLFIIALGFVALAIMEGGFTYTSGRLAARTAEGIALRLRNYVFDHIQRLTFSYHDKTQTGELIQRSTSDIDALRRFYADQAIGVGRIGLLFIINLIALLNLNTRLGLISILVVPFIILTSISFFRKVTKAYEAYQEQDAVVSTTLQENLTGVRVVKAFARQEYEREKFEKDNWEKFLRGRRLLMMHSTFWPLSDILCGAQMLGGFIFAAMMVINQTISVGTYLAYAGLVVWLIWPMRNLGRLIVQTSTGLVSYDRVMEIVKEEREDLITGNSILSGPVRGEFIFDKVCFEYERGVPVLENITFHCPSGAVVAIMGLTGSGKSSLINLIPRFYEYTSGKIFLDGIELKNYPRAFLRRQIGIVEQEPFLFSRSLRENIIYGAGRQVTEEEIISAAKAAAIHETILNLPNNYQARIGEKGVTLSGGQKQRIAIARALIKDPRILILDDATSSVDTQTESDIQAALNILMQGRTSFVIAHRVQSVMNADLIIVLDKGRIEQIGKHNDLIQQPGVYRSIYDIQTLIEIELEKEIASAELMHKSIESE